MLSLYPPFQALLDAAPAGWTRVLPTLGQSAWRHTQGLSLVAQRSRTKIPAPRWALDLTLGRQHLNLSLPRTHRRSLGGDMMPILRDIGVWIDAMNLQTRERLARHIAAWILHQGRMDLATESLALCLHNSPRSMTVVQREMHIPMPARLVDLMLADIDAVFATDELPSHIHRHVEWTPGRIFPGSIQSFDMLIPKEEDARTQILMHTKARIKNVPFPAG